MPSTQIISGILYGVKAVTILPLTTDGRLPSTPEVFKLKGINEVPMQSIIEQGERAVDKADGVGVIGIHEEDDTLVGVDLSILLNIMDFNMVFETFGGTLLVDESDKVTGIKMPTIQEQRANPKRFQMDIYVESITAFSTDGYVRHRFAFCGGIVKDFTNTMGKFSEYSLYVKAREHPTDLSLHEMEYVTVLP